MTKLSVLVVDDEPLARRRISRLLQKLEWAGSILEAGNIDDACARVAECPPDILLLDIQMPGGDGFELLERLAEDLPAVVFITAFDHHALRAFEVNAIDYITKPIEPGRFDRALERARIAAESQSQTDRYMELQETVTSLKRALGSQTKRSGEFWVKSQGGHLRIGTEEILRFQADRDYVRLHVRDADYLYQESLTALERRLDPGDFLRVHRGAIVRRDAIARIKPAPFGSLILVLADGSEVRVGRTYTTAIRAGLTASS